MQVTVVVQGVLHKIEPTVVKDGGQYRHFRLYVENERDAKYSDILEFSLFGDKCYNLDKFRVGQRLEVKADLTGRERDVNGKVFVNMQLRAWYISEAGQAVQPAQQMQTVHPHYDQFRPF